MGKHDLVRFVLKLELWVISMLRRLPRTDNCFFDFRNLSCIWKLSFIEVSSVEPLDYSHALLWKKGSEGGSSKMRITGQWACVVFVLACGAFICIKFDKNIKRQRIPLFRYLTLYMLCIWHRKDIQRLKSFGLQPLSLRIFLPQFVILGRRAKIMHNIIPRR